MLVLRKEYDDKKRLAFKKITEVDNIVKTANNNFNLLSQVSMFFMN